MKNNKKCFRKYAKQAAAIAMAVVIAMGTVSFDLGTGSNESYGASWADPYLDNLVKQNVMRGDSSGNLYPDNNITRAEFVAMVNRAFGYTEKAAVKFKDVDSNAWYVDDIAVAYKQGYFQGSGKNLANPDGLLKREEAVVLLCRALKIEGSALGPLAFDDSTSFSSWSKDYINAAIEKNYINGYPDGTFRPASPMTRGEMAKVLTDVAGDIVKQPGINTVGYTKGNVSVVKSGSNLNDTTVSGDLYITAGMGLGATLLENVVVQGDLIVSGTGESQNGENSVILSNCSINNLIVDSSENKIVSLRAENNSDIKRTTVKCNAFLEEDEYNRNSAFRDVIMDGPSGAKLGLSGDFENITLKGPGNIVSVNKGYVDRLTVDELAVGASIFVAANAGIGEVFLDVGTKITGTGSIDSIVINTMGTTVQMMPDEIHIRPGVTASVGGQVMGDQEAEINSRSPEFEDGYPQLYEAGPTTADFLVETNKPGKVYWVVKEASNTDSISREEIKTPKTGSVLKSGSLGVTAEKEATVKVSGLTSGVQYTFIAVFTDMRDEDSSIEKERFTTIDNIVPTFLTGYPKVKTADTTSLNLSAYMSKDCDLYWAALPTKSVAPTVDEVLNQNAPGAVQRGVAGGAMKNVEKEIMVSGLTEYVTYDIYIAAKDNKGNKSRIAKLTATTLDKTPPKFIAGPDIGTATANSVQIKFTSNETGSLYWVAMKKGGVFPRPVPPATTAPAFELAGDAVIAGNNVDIKGTKVAMTENKATTFNVSGLAKEMNYDLYLVLQDKSGNLSPVKMIPIKPNDTTPPTAVLEFPYKDQESGKPVADANFMMNFSEIACYSSGTGISGVSLMDLQKSDPGKLENCITLWDNTDTPTKMPIKYEKLMIREEGGKTIIEFSTEAVQLRSGSNYQFELNKIQDTSGNKMPLRTMLPSFSMAPPNVKFTRVDPDSAANADLGITLNPSETNAGDTTCYDTVFGCSDNIGFDLLMKKYETKDDGTILLTTESALGLSMRKESAYTLNSLLHGSNLVFEPFNKLQKVEYQIDVTSIDGNTNQASWDRTVKFTVKGLTGAQNNMVNMSNLLRSKGWAGLNEAAGITVVGTLKDSDSNFSFADIEDPIFINGMPIFTEGETKMGVQVQANKASTMYYVAAKETSPGAFATATPTAFQLEEGNFTGKNFSWGKIDIQQASYLVDGTIANLEADTNYRIFYVLQGKNFRESQVYSQDRRTRLVNKPEWAAGDFRYEPDVESATVHVELKKDESNVDDTVIYWAVYQKDVVFDGGSTSPSAADIMGKNPGGESSGRQPICSGSEKASSGVDIPIKCTGLTDDRQYKFYAVAVKALADEPSEVKGIAHVVPLDATMPSIIGLLPSIDASPSDGAIQKYSGSVTITFSEPLYYRNSDTGNPEMLTKQVALGRPSIVKCASGSFAEVISAEEMEITNMDGSVKGYAVNSMEIAFSQFKAGAHGSYIQLPRLGDVRNNRGELILILQDDPNIPGELTFVPNDKWQ